MTAVCLICITLFADETFYNRHIPAAQQPVPKSRWRRLVGIEQWESRKQRSTFWEALMRPCKVIAKPTVLLSCTYYCFTFAWVVGINTTLSIFVTPLYNFGLKQVGMRPLLPLVPNAVKSSSDYLFQRVLLLHPRRRRPPRRARRTLAPRPRRPHLHAPQRRRPRTRSSSLGHLAFHSLHDLRPRPYRLLPRKWLPLHDHVPRLGPVRLRHHDYHCGDLEL